MSAPLTIFPTRTNKGRSLAAAVARLGERQGYAVTIAEPERATQPDLLQACMGPGVVVFDATIEGNGRHNYALALYTLKYIPFALVVSRSYLPTNFAPLLDGGYPLYPRRLTNEEILQWLDRQLVRLRQRVPRPKSLQGLSNAERLIDMGIEESKERRHRQGAIFISFRGTYEQTVARLAEMTRLGVKKSVRFFSTGELAPPNELMSAQDRWGVMRTINEWIADSEELWIFWSADYLASWWTRAELTLLAGQFRRMRSRVLLYDQHTRATHRLEGVKSADIGSENRDLIAERLLIGRNPEWLSRSDRTTAVPGGLDRHGSPTLTTNRYRDDLIFSCPVCTSRAVRRSPPRAPRNFNDLMSFDVRDVIDIADPSLMLIDRNELASSISNGVGSVICPNCDSALRVYEGPPRYWFYPVRTSPVPPFVERGTGPGGIILESRPVYMLG
jgi:hypothetical protein